ncbi:MAG: hypothetical protein M1835_000664 [Candelina submexicana]|nr:MAG: hypothetical protein M1835_000664 [Candelina submexicana]
MRRTSLLAACLAAVPVIVSAHGGIPGAPKIFGRHPLAQIKARNVFESPMEKHGAIPTGPHLDPRANIDGQCGAQYGSCAAGYCCSSAGYCGKGPEYCNSPDCQFNYGPGCDANKTPAGVSTASIARPKLGNVLYGGAGIYDCTVPGTIALTYDDGPYIYTSDILDILKSYNAKATFFMTGINNGKGEIDNASTIYPAIIKRAYAEGHQIASHTWSHQDLSAITQQQRKDQMYKQERALANILGFFPTYMRPPYSSCNGPCQTDMGTLGYHISYFDVDTDDYDNDSPTLIQNSKNNFVNGIAGGTPQNNDYLVIGHDIHEQTAHNLTAFMLDQIKSRGYRAVTMGECMGDGPSNWYRSVGGAPASTPVVLLLLFLHPPRPPASSAQTQLVVVLLITLAQVRLSARAAQSTAGVVPPTPTAVMAAMLSSAPATMAPASPYLHQ